MSTKQSHRLAKAKAEGVILPQVTLGTLWAQMLIHPYCDMHLQQIRSQNMAQVHQHLIPKGGLL